MLLLFDPQSASAVQGFEHQVLAAHKPLAHWVSVVHGSPMPAPVPPLLVPLLPLLLPPPPLQAVVHGVVAQSMSALAVAFARAHASVVQVWSAVTQL